MKRVTLPLLLLALMGVLGATGCDREGPLERAGEDVDEAARDLREGTAPEREQRP